MRAFIVAVAGLTFVSSVASAEPPPKASGAPASGAAAMHGDRKGEGVAVHGEKKGEGAVEPGDKKVEGATARGDKKVDDDDDDAPAGATAAAGKPPVGRRTPAQLAFRQELWKRREQAIEAKVHKGGRRLTEEEREAVKAHWLRVSRLMRIRELAQEDKADAIVKRADAALAREEKKMDTKLDKITAKATGGVK